MKTKQPEEETIEEIIKKLKSKEYIAVKENGTIKIYKNDEN